ncbi:hypothetical protein [Paraglaciecola sp.]|uniref:hypothetical protein n=1 Tax=Paraglaciecola sp. TaxID=1920173 RepID=UPI0030F3BBD8
MLGLNAVINKDYVTAELMFANSAERINQPWLSLHHWRFYNGADVPLYILETARLLAALIRPRRAIPMILGIGSQINDVRKHVEIKQVMQEITQNILVALDKLTG